MVGRRPFPYQTEQSVAMEEGQGRMDILDGMCLKLRGILAVGGGKKFLSKVFRAGPLSTNPSPVQRKNSISLPPCLAANSTMLSSMEPAGWSLGE